MPLMALMSLVPPRRQQRAQGSREKATRGWLFQLLLRQMRKDHFLTASGAEAAPPTDAAAAPEAAFAAALAALAAMAAAEAAVSVTGAGAGAGATTGAGAGTTTSSFLPQAARATAATSEARTIDLFIRILRVFQVRSGSLGGTLRRQLNDLSAKTLPSKTTVVALSALRLP